MNINARGVRKTAKESFLRSSEEAEINFTLCGYRIRTDPLYLVIRSRSEALV